MKRNVQNYEMYLESLENNVNKIEGVAEILALIGDNLESGWKGDKLQESFDCVVLGDVEHTHEEAEGHTTYNGWYEKLEELAKRNPELQQIILMIDENRETLWEHGLGETFSCVITEDIEVTVSDEDYNNIYNGWYEILKELA
jgi:hypothetical protein